MAIIIGASLTGVRTNRALPRGPIVAADLRAVASDNALCFETMTNLAADESGGAPGTDGHAHGANDGDGNLIFWPLATQNFGPDAPDGVRDPAAFASGAGSYQLPPQIGEDSSTTRATIIVFYQPFYVPRGFENRDLLVLIESYGFGGGVPRFLATLATWGTSSPPTSTVYSTATPVPGYEGVTFDTINLSFYNEASGISQSQAVPDSGIFAAVVQASSSGIHTLKIEFPAQPFDFPVNTVIRNLSIIAALDANQLPAVNGRRIPTKQLAPASGANNVVVGDPDGTTLGYDYEPVDDSIVADDDAMGPVLSINNRNSALIEEWARGLPASGNSSMTVAGGHIHLGSGDAPKGKIIEMCLGSWAFGCSDNAILALGGSTRILSPLSLTTNAVPVFQMALWTPQHGTNTHLYGAVLVRSDNGKDVGEFKLTSDPGYTGSSPTTVTYTSTGAPDGYQLITSATQFTATSGGVTGFKLTQKKVAVASGRVGVMGLTIFVNE